MSSIIDRIPLTPIFPARPKRPRSLALSGVKLIETVTGSQEHVREGIERIETARAAQTTALTPYELYCVGTSLLTTPWLEAHVVGMALREEAATLDPAAVAKADAEFEAEAETWPKEGIISRSD